MPAFPGAVRTIVRSRQIIDNEGVGDLSRVEDEEIDLTLRQAGTEATHTSGIRRGNGWREGAGDAG